MQPAPRSIQQTIPPAGPRACRPEPIQLCLIPDQVPPPPADLLGVLPQTDVGEALMVLARMFTQAAKPLIAEAGDE